MAKDKVAVALLVEDTSIYPRETIDDVHVTDLANALRAGHELPALIVDDASLRIVDGVHRARAHRRVFGDETEVAVIRKSYGSEAEIFEDAVKLNSGHGRKLQRIDQIRIVTRARDLDMPDVTIAEALHIPTERVAKLAIRVASVADSTGKVALKHGFRQWGGRIMTPEQALEHRRQRAGHIARLVNELYGRLEQNLDDLNALDEPTKEKLANLAILISEKLEQVEKVEEPA